VARNANSSPTPQDYELVDQRFPLQGDSYEELMVRETRAFAVMEARLALSMWRVEPRIERGFAE
jgi:hypothetical protein